MTTYDDGPDLTGKLSLAEILEVFTAGNELPLKFTAYDGSSAGPDDAEIVLDLRTPRGTTYLATAPGDLGLARAYVCTRATPMRCCERWPGTSTSGVRRPGCWLRSSGPSAWNASGRFRRPRRRPSRNGGVSQKECATARFVMPRPFITTTTCRTRSTNGCSGRR